MTRLRTVLSAISVALALSSAAHAQAVQGLDGRWEGPVQLPNGGKLTAVFRVETKSGKTTTVFDSPSQGAYDVAAGAKRDGDKVTFDVPTGGVVVTGSLAADGKTIKGEISQGGGSLPLVMTRTSTSAARVAAIVTGPLVQGLDGNWEGAIETPGGNLRGVFHITSDGKATTTLMDSPDQGVTGIPAVAKRSGSKVTIDVAGTGGGFEGELAADGKSIKGVWNQNGMSMPLVITKK